MQGHIFLKLFLTLPSQGFPKDSVGKESACNARDMCSIPGLGRSPGEEHGNPLQYSCVENPLRLQELLSCKELDTHEANAYVHTYPSSHCEKSQR